MSATKFSYAQAARGQLSPQTATFSASEASATTPLAVQERDSHGSSATSDNEPSLNTFIPVDTIKALAKGLNHDHISSPHKVYAEVPSSPAPSSTLVGTNVESTSNFSLDEAACHASTGYQLSRVSTPGTRSSSTDDLVRKGGRKSQTTAKVIKDREQFVQARDSEKVNETAKIELAPAPLPIVNIWSQRMMEHVTKSKQPKTMPFSKSTSGTATRPGAASLVSSNVTKAKDSKKNVGGDSTDTNGSHSSSAKASMRKLNESLRAVTEQPRRTSARGMRDMEKDDKAAVGSRIPMPSVHDATSWPTPESSAVADGVRPNISTESPGIIDKDARDEVGSSRYRKKGWLPLPFVPTVSFQTPVPNGRSSKPKQNGRGVRDASSKNNYNGNAINSAAPTKKELNSTFPHAKSGNIHRDNSKDGHDSTLPTRPSAHTAGIHSHSSVDASSSHAREPQKASAALPDKPNGTSLKLQAITGNTEHRSETPHTGGSNGDTNRQHQSAYPAHFDRHALSTKYGGHHNLLGKEDSPQGHKEQHVPNLRERTETRGERYSRSGFRGNRGGSCVQTQHSHSTYLPIGHRVVVPSSYNAGPAAIPPAAIPFNPPSQQSAYASLTNSARPVARVSSRSQAASQPPVSLGNRPQNGSHRMHIQSPQGTPSAPSDFQIQPFAFPNANPYMDAELLHGLTLQVEYYFSLDNLCKDVFLRRKMNDQGFVPLLVIAKFKRMSDLAPSVDFIRAACEQSENIDYVTDQDQNEWIRSRFLWGSFILPPDERDEEARKPGPDLRTALFHSAHTRSHQAYLHYMTTSGYSTTQQPMFSPPLYLVNEQELLYAANSSQVDHTITACNGVAGLKGRSHGAGSQLSATVPDFSPSGQNGGAPTTLEDYQTYPDEQVEKLIVLVESDLETMTFEASDQPYSGSLGSASNLSAKNHAQNSGFSCESSSTNKSSPNRGSPNNIPDFDTSALEVAGRKVGKLPYPELRAKALEQRAAAKPGETPAAMKHLYRFWSHCLPDKFNVRMYEDFRMFALEDVRRNVPIDFGLKCLLRYYNQVLFDSGGTRPYPAVFIPHHSDARNLSEPLKTGINGESQG